MILSAHPDGRYTNAVFDEGHGYEAAEVEDIQHAIELLATATDVQDTRHIHCRIVLLGGSDAHWQIWVDPSMGSEPLVIGQPDFTMPMDPTEHGPDAPHDTIHRAECERQDSE